MEFLKQNLSGFETHLRDIKSESLRTISYPDGTQLIEGGGSFLKLRYLLINERFFDAGGIYQGPDFMSVSPFPHKVYTLWYTFDYNERMGDDDAFSVFFPKIHTFPTNDYRVEDLQITAMFHRKPSRRVQEKFAKFLGGWFESVADVGLFGEGPIMKASEEVAFQGQLAKFRVNASQSGQDTLNWLLISVFNFGYEVSPVEHFIFDQEQQLKNFISPFDKKVEGIVIK